MESPPSCAPREKGGRKGGLSAERAAAAAYDEAVSKLDAVIAQPCREDCLDAIALCKRAAAHITREREARLRALVREKRAAQARETAKRKVAAAKLRAAAKGAKRRELAARKRQQLDAGASGKAKRARGAKGADGVLDAAGSRSPQPQLTADEEGDLRISTPAE